MSFAGKVIGIFFILLFAVGAVVGLMAIYGKTPTTPFVDTYNSTTTNISNSTQEEVVRHVNTGSQVGVAAVYIIGGLLIIVVIIGGVYLIFR